MNEGCNTASSPRTQAWAPKHPHPSLYRFTAPPRRPRARSAANAAGASGLAPAPVRTVAYKAVAFLEITCGEYQARCDCCTTFRNSPEGVLPRALYDNKVRDLVLDRILKDGMSVERTLESLRREYLLDLSTGFVYDVLHDHARQLDMAEHRRKVLEHFSGTLCVDELHLGRFTLLLATDPLADLPVAFALVDKNDQDHMRRFLQNLKNWGLTPKVVVTDGSNLYPAVLAELWPDADHQLCVFHVIKDINKLILDAVRRMRTAMSRRGKAGRKKKRGRKGAKSKAAAARRGMTVKEKANFVFKHRHLIVKRRENLTESRTRRPDAGCWSTCPSWRRCGGSPTGSTGCSTRPRTSIRRVAAGLRSCVTQSSRPCRSWPRRWSN